MGLLWGSCRAGRFGAAEGSQHCRAKLLLLLPCQAAGGHLVRWWASAWHWEETASLPSPFRACPATPAKQSRVCKGPHSEEQQALWVGELYFLAAL